MNGRDLERAAAADLKKVLDRFFETRRGVFDAAAAAIASCLDRGGKVLAFGNGGSAAEAQHFVAELVNGLARRDGPPLAAVALTADASCLTAVGNDRGFERVFSRQIEALGKAGDVALGLTTSGRSPDVLGALRTARRLGLVTVALSGESVDAAAPLADILLDVPSRDTPRVQEAHLLILHLMAARLEATTPKPSAED
jgi:D-sedoheptulose 7-phosphate isomerase